MERDNQMKRRTAFFLVFFSLGWAAERRAKNVILFLGDAGGIPTLHAASIYRYQDATKLFIQHMPYIALSDTSTASSWVTDSAAGMTAIVTGQRTHDGVLSQSDAAVNGKKDGEPLKTILEYAEERGLSTGVISNDSVAGATPAACYAHSNDRDKIGEIFVQVLTPRFGDGVDVIIGAGRKGVLAATAKLGVNLAEALPRKGLPLYDSVAAIPTGARRAVVLLDQSDFDLLEATERAIRILSQNPKGFFLMVEWDVHTDHLMRGLERTIVLDRAIQRVAERTKDRTLILFTADHSFDIRVRGGRKGRPLLEPAASGAQAAQGRPNVRMDDGHTGEHVLVAAQGPGATRVHGYLANTDLFHIMMAAYGWERWRPGGAVQAPR